MWKFTKSFHAIVLLISCLLSSQIEVAAQAPDTSKPPSFAAVGEKMRLGKQGRNAVTVQCLDKLRLAIPLASNREILIFSAHERVQHNSKS